MIGKKITVRVSEDAYLKLKEDAWKARKSMSDLINDIILGNKPLKDKKPKASIAIQDGTKVKDAYAAAFKSRYKLNPVWAAKESVLAKKLIQSVGLERAIQVASRYPFYNDPWHVGQKHPFGLLISQINKVLVELDNPNRMLDQTIANKELKQAGDDVGYKQKLASLQEKATKRREIINRVAPNFPHLRDYEIDEMLDRGEITYEQS
jgi:predicted CopG family antitoxin